jgi:hypothetical protein
MKFFAVQMQEFAKVFCNFLKEKREAPMLEPLSVRRSLGEDWKVKYV